MIVSKDIKKRFVRAAIIVGSMFLVAAGSVGIYRGVFMMNSLREIKKELVNNDYVINYVELSDNQFITEIEQSKLVFEKKRFIISNDKFRICAEYKLNSDYQIEISSCDSLSDIMCGVFSLAVYQDGLFIMNDRITISAVRGNANASTELVE